jgi:hypothetical protein
MSSGATVELTQPRGSANFDLQKLHANTLPRLASNDLFGAVWV